MSDSSRAQLYYVEESTWGDTPASALTELRFTSESLGQTSSTTTSNEIRSDRQTTDMLRTTVEAAGDANIEISYGAYDDLIAGALMDDWTAAVAVSATDIAADDSGSQFTSTTTDFTTENIELGQWLKVGGFATAGNNGYFQVTSLSANAIGVTPAPGAAEAAGETVTMAGSRVTNGVTDKSFTLEKLFSDISEYVSFVGMRVGGMTLNIQPGQIMTGAFSFMGKSAAAAGSSVGTGTPNAAAANSVLNAIDNVDDVREAGDSSSLDFTEISIQIENNLRSQQAIGTLGAIGIGLGRVSVSGTVQAYFTSRTLYEKFLNDTESSLSFRLVDGDGNAYVIDMPRLKYSEGNPVAGGNDQDVMVPLAYTAFRDPEFGYTIAINRFPSA